MSKIARIGLFFGIVLAFGLGATRVPGRGLSAAGYWLNVGKNWPERPVQIAFVLAGGARDRGLAAAQAWRQGRIERLVVTGGLTPEPLQAAGILLNEAELTARVLRRQGVPDTVLTLVPRGSSTHDECVWIVDSARRAGLRHIAIVSHIHHTRRIRWQVNRLLSTDDTLQVWVIGVPPQDYSPERWWHSEQGLLFVVNEYLKLAYYVVTY